MQMKTETPTITSSTAGSSSLTLSSSVPAPRSTGKPLAMMAEMANKTKMASAHAAKATGMTKSVHLGKNKASNGVEDSGTHVVKVGDVGGQGMGGVWSEELWKSRNQEWSFSL